MSTDVAADADAQLSDKLNSLSMNDTVKRENKPVKYSQEEIKAIKEVYDNLTTEKKIDPSRIGLRCLALVTIVSKLRVDEASGKYIKLMEALETCSLDSLKETDTKVEELMKDKDVLEIMTAYVGTGRDNEDRQIFWIRGNSGYAPEMEKAYYFGGLIYWLAVHADDISIHEGVTFVIDLTRSPLLDQKFGNEKKLQRLNQSFPMRPQTIKLAGAGRAKRLLINALIKVASFFTKQKILDRIRFVTMEDAVNSIPKESAPRYVGGGGGGIEDLNEWAKERVLSLPIPEL